MDHYDTIVPLCWISRVLGVAPYYPKEDQNKIRKLSCPQKNLVITFIVLFLFYTAFIYLRLKANPYDTTCFLSTVIGIGGRYEVWSGALMLTIIYLYSFIKRPLLVEAHSTITEVDKGLARLNKTINFSRIRKIVTCFTFGFILLDVGVIIVLNFQTFKDNFDKAFRIFMETIPSLIALISTLNFIAIMICLRYRYKAINDLLVRNSKMLILSEKDNKSKLLQEQELDDIIRMHEQLSDVADDVNSSFGVILLFVFSFLFTMVILLSYIASKLLVMNSLFGISDLKTYAFLLYYQMTLYMARMSVVIFSVEIATSEVGTTHAFVHKTINLYQDKDIKNKLTIFLMQLINRKPVFTAFGLFDVNLPLLFSMIGTLFTYLIILIQFDMDDQDCKSFLAPNATNQTTEP